MTIDISQIEMDGLGRSNRSDPSNVIRSEPGCGLYRDHINRVDSLGLVAQNSAISVVNTGVKIHHHAGVKSTSVGRAMAVVGVASSRGVRRGRSP